MKRHFFFLVALLVGIASLVFLLMSALGHKAALPYAGYLSCVILYILSADDYLYRVFFPDALPYVYVFENIISALGLTLAFLFGRAFLNTQYSGRIINAFLLFCAACSAGLGLFSVLTDFKYGNIVYPLMGILMLFLPISGAIAVRKRLRGGWPFLLGCLVISVSLFAQALFNYFSAEFRFIDVTAFLRHAVVIEALAFAFAMFSQVRGVREDKESALQAELQATREKLALSEAMATTAHDIQQPLVSLRMAMLQSDKNKEHATDIGHAFDYLQEIVSNNLTPAPPSMQPQQALTDALADDRHCHGSVSTDAEAVEEFAVSIVLQNASSMFQEEAKAKGVDLRVVVSSQTVRVSPLVLMRIVSNLVSNAVKNTDSGKVLIGCRRRGERLRIDVCDSGCGFSPEMIAEMQKPYQRQGDYQGTGLGLSIVRQLCDENDLQFTIRSEQGCGSVISVAVLKGALASAQ